MSLVCDSNMLLESTLGVTFLYLLKHILHPSFPPSIAHQFCGMPTWVALTAHTSLQPGTHARAAQTTESADLHIHISVSASPTWPAALVLTTLSTRQSAAITVSVFRSTHLPPLQFEAPKHDTTNQVHRPTLSFTSCIPNHGSHSESRNLHDLARGTANSLLFQIPTH